MGSVGGDKRSQVRILLVDDHPLVRERLREVIESEGDLAICGEAEDRQSALELASRHGANLVILDLSLKGSHGMDLIKDLRNQHPDLAVLVLSMHDESLYAERVVRAGAQGYITKQEATKSILEAIRTVLAGDLYLSPAQMARTASKLAGRPRAKLGLATDGLTDRELIVFELLGAGLSTRQVAERLRLEIRTVETYRARIKEKLHLKNASQLLHHAIRWVEDGAGRK